MTLDECSHFGNNGFVSNFAVPSRSPSDKVKECMRLIGLGVLHEFCLKHAECKSWIECWISDVKASTWSSLNDLKLRYPSASILPGNIVIFNVKGNGYRLVVQVAIRAQTIAVTWAGTHAEYSRRKF